MKYTICEKMMWFMMNPPIFRCLKKDIPSLNIQALKKKAKKNYKEMVGRTPDIGPMTKNPLRVSLSGGIVWLSIYDAMDGAMTHEQFGKMVSSTMDSAIIRKVFSSKKPFSVKAQLKRVSMAEVSNAISDSEFNWKTEVIPGRDADELTMNYHQCGLCALGRQEHHEDLVPLMCAMDIQSVDLMGGVLHRTGTIATGAEYCDFYIVKKGSKWDK